jgi:hypothetical protein
MTQLDKLRGVLGGMIGKGLPLSKKKSMKMKFKTSKIAKKPNA